MLSRMFVLTVASLLGPVFAAQAAAAACYDWPLREQHNRFAYDGDTIYVTVPDFPLSLQEVNVRLSDVDAPEIRAKCDEERYQATAARDYLDHLLRNAERVSFCEPSWGKYGGRVVAGVRVDGRDVGESLVAAGYARPYDGGRRKSWCRAD